jgi:ethanolamine utilization protein EutN
MRLATVIGLAVVSPKSGELDGCRFAVVQPLDARLEQRGRAMVAVDTVGAGHGQTVITVSAGPARTARGLANRPVDLAVIGIVDETVMEER